MARKCTDLKENEQVVFRVYDPILERKAPINGNVIYVLSERRTVCVCYLCGVRSETADIPFEDMLAVYDPHGKHLRFDNIHGPSQELLPE